MQSSPVRAKRVFSFYSDAMSFIIVEGFGHHVPYNHDRCRTIKRNSKKKTLRTHRSGFFTPEVDHSYSLEDQFDEFLFHNYMEMN